MTIYTVMFSFWRYKKEEKNINIENEHGDIGLLNNYKCL